MGKSICFIRTIIRFSVPRTCKIAPRRGNSDDPDAVVLCTKLKFLPARQTTGEECSPAASQGICTGDETRRLSPNKRGFSKSGLVAIFPHDVEGITRGLNNSPDPAPMPEVRNPMSGPEDSISNWFLRSPCATNFDGWCVGAVSSLIPSAPLDKIIYVFTIPSIMGPLE